MLNRIISLFAALIIIVPFFSVAAEGAELSVSAHSAILMSADTGEIIFSKNAYEKRGIASTTKIMTSVLAIESGLLEKEIVAKKEDVTVEGTSIGLKDGDRVTLRTLVEGMLLESGNDAANVTAVAVGKTREGFVEKMNEKAKELGMSSSSFKNPSGLTEEGHYSTAFDMAVLASYAIKNDEFRRICSSKSIRVFYGGSDCYRTFYNHNKLLGGCEGVFGIKTGFTKASGRCLVSVAERNGITLVCVTLNAPNDWQDHKKLYDYGFGKAMKKEIILEENVKIKVAGSENTFVSAEAKEPLKINVFSNKAVFRTEIYCEKFLYSGIKKGDKIGFVRVLGYMDRILSEVSLYAGNDASTGLEAPEKPSSFKERLRNLLKGKSD